MGIILIILIKGILMKIILELNILIDLPHFNEFTKIEKISSTLLRLT